MLRTLKSLLPLAAGALALAACETSDGSSLTGIPGGQAAFVVRLTDAPGDLAEAWIRVQKIQLVGGDSARADSGKTSLRELIPTDSGWINLLAYTGGKSTELFSGGMPAGRYSQVRLIVCDMYIKTTDGQYIATPGAKLPADVKPASGSELKLTSQCQSGFKVMLRGDSLRLGADSASTLTIDFDAKQSFAHQAGKSGKWIVNPVLFGTVSRAGTPGSGAGSIAGNVTLPQGLTLPVACGGKSLSADSLLKTFVPTAAKGDTIHAGATTAAGAFTIANLPPATYTLGYEKIGFSNGDSLGYTAVPTPATAAVTAGNTAAVNYAVSAVACKVKS